MWQQICFASKTIRVPDDPMKSRTIQKTGLRLSIIPYVSYTPTGLLNALPRSSESKSYSNRNIQLQYYAIIDYSGRQLGRLWSKKIIAVFELTSIHLSPSTQ